MNNFATASQQSDCADMHVFAGRYGLDQRLYDTADFSTNKLHSTHLSLVSAGGVYILTILCLIIGNNARG